MCGSRAFGISNSTGDPTTRALYPAVTNPHAYPKPRNDEGLEPWAMLWWWMSSDNPDHSDDVTASFDMKLAALSEYASQVAHMLKLKSFISG